MTYSSDALHLLDTVSLLRCPAFVAYHDQKIAPELVCSAIGARLKKPATIARLQSDHITAADGKFIRDEVLTGKLLLLLIASEAKELPYELIMAWAQFAEHPRNTIANAGRFVHFGLEDRQQDIGTLGLILQKGYRSRHRWSTPVIAFQDQQDLGNAEANTTEVRALGRAAVPISMKTLCLLHHRDLEGVPQHRSSHDVINGRDPLTWRDLQTCLRDQADNEMLSILEQLERKGRVTSMQLDFAVSAVAYLRDEAQKEQPAAGGLGLHTSIYHALWDCAWLENRGCVFRGQRSNSWRQDSTLLRPEDGGTPASIDTILARLYRTQAFLDALADCETELVGRALDEDERLAIAQHYGFATGLLDYSRSLSVAAFFATGSGDQAKIQDGDIGIIYYILPDTSMAREPVSKLSDGLHLAQATGLRIGQLRIIEPELPDPENRIARQRGLFIEGFDSRDLQRFSAGFVYFRQSTGVCFEDARLGITREALLKPDSKLQQLADTVAPSTPRLSKRLTAVRVPSDDLFGRLGLHLYSNLHKGQRFLDHLVVAAERAEIGLWAKIKLILEGHLATAMIAARTDDVYLPNQTASRRRPEGRQPVFDVTIEALDALAALAGLDTDMLAQIKAHRPSSIRPNMGDRYDDLQKLRQGTPKARIAVAVGLFIIGLEHLRTVAGDTAEQYIQDADARLLGPLETFLDLETQLRPAS